MNGTGEKVMTDDDVFETFEKWREPNFPRSLSKDIMRALRAMPGGK